MIEKKKARLAPQMSSKVKSKSERSMDLRDKQDALRVLELVRNAVRSKTALGTIRDMEGSDPFRILISTILSARTRDPVTEKASERLFSRFPDAEALSRARSATVAKLIKPVAFYQQKAKRLIEASRDVMNKFGGRVPKSYEDLLTLPGVGRKTAGCVLVYGFGEPAIPVDIHVHRISNRIGIVKTETPEETEAALLKVYDKKYWIDLNELFVSFGQTICRPSRPKCEICPVKGGLCNYYKSNFGG